MSTKRKLTVTKKQWAIIGGALTALALGGYFLVGHSGGQSETSTETYQIAQVTEGSIASSTLLTGTVKALSEQKVYYDTSKGDITTFFVNVGDKVIVGQPLVQYSTKSAQSAYDQAVRSLNKIGRQIHELKTYGLPATETVSEDGSVTSNIAEVQRSADSQLADLNDAYANAQQDVDKAQEALNQLLVTSTVEGTVVEVTKSIDPSKTGGQIIVHIVSEGQLQVEGALTEYDMANMAVNQEVKLTSKVFPDKSWPGKISYISNYPADSSSGAATGGTSNSASYPFKVDLTGDAAGLRQGFKVNIEVLNKAINKLVPTSAIMADGDKSYVWVYDKSKKTIKKVDVTLGRADATNQEVLTGLDKDQIVVANPSVSFTEGQELNQDQIVDLTTLEQEAD